MFLRVCRRGRAPRARAAPRPRARRGLLLATRERSPLHPRGLENACPAAKRPRHPRAEAQPDPAVRPGGSPKPHTGLTVSTESERLKSLAMATRFLNVRGDYAPTGTRHTFVRHSPCSGRDSTPEAPRGLQGSVPSPTALPSPSFQHREPAWAALCGAGAGRGPRRPSSAPHSPPTLDALTEATRGHAGKARSSTRQD